MKTKNLEVIFHSDIPVYEVNGTVIMNHNTTLNFAAPGTFLFETEEGARSFTENEIAKS